MNVITCMITQITIVLAIFTLIYPLLAYIHRHLRLRKARFQFAWAYQDWKDSGSVSSLNTASFWSREIGRLHR